MFDKRGRLRLEGTIAGAGFESGDRFVAGIWERGPLGPMADVMWALPAGGRVLLAPSDDAATFIGGVYSFEEVRVCPVTVRKSRPARLSIQAGPLELDLIAGGPVHIFSVRPRSLRRSPSWVRIEDLLFRPLAGRFLRGLDGVHAYGTSASGVKEWYCIDDYRPVVAGAAALDGQDLGDLRPLDPPANFGFSEFPRRPALVRCAPLLEGAERFLPHHL
jgi:hypothetical protein